MTRRLMLLVVLGLVGACRRPVPKPQPQPQPSVIAKGRGPGLSFDADATEAFWAEGTTSDGPGRVVSVPLAGGPVRELAGGNVAKVHVSGAWVYFVRRSIRPA